jgi:hypothetical protein
MQRIFAKSAQPILLLMAATLIVAPLMAAHPGTAKSPQSPTGRHGLFDHHSGF